MDSDGTDRTGDRTDSAGDGFGGALGGGSGRACVWLLVCGERMREDDGVADVAAELLPADIRAIVRVEHVGVLSVEALLDVPAECGVVVADLAAGVDPGVVVTLALSEVRRGGIFPSTTHVIPPDEIIATAAELGGRPPRGLFVGIGGAEFGFGDSLSAVVAASLPEYVAALVAAIRAQAG